MQQAGGIDSHYAWARLGASVALSVAGGVGMWSLVVMLPIVQKDLGVSRADISFAYTMNMLGFCAGGVLMGRLVDLKGIVVTAILSAVLMAAGFVATAVAPSLGLYSAGQVLLGFGCAATFAPLVADISHWFEKRRGVAVAIAASGNYLAGTIWPPLIEIAIRHYGWRDTCLVTAALALIAMVPLALCLRRPPPFHAETGGGATAPTPMRSVGMSPNALQGLLAVAGITCCVAMSMPQVHIVAYCGDLGYGPARGAEMLSMMLGFGLISRITGGFIADRIGGVATLLVSSVLQGVALLLYVFFDGLFSLYVISALFGLFQGSIVPMYAIIVREYFAPQEAGTRLGVVLLATLGGMALGGWLSGLFFDLTGSYQAAFLNGLGWNLVNVSIMTWLLFRPGRRMVPA